ncbi:putative F-box protein PP2-B12 [Camellia sinensis]|uniref:F-box domain-containing protein n=1 Tax=Camellia sinensis var. sinensis TaxID=542762 RepID=A0A4S4F3W5_CAMSN|nr:putative F-box protein PP2-B12 [Camellia sinensis]THG23912.1 hypothetical protein TEA_016729 [Camellia sinensis var. sinensis]
MEMEMDLFSSLPEGCISAILSFTSPLDVCRSSTLSWGFKLASDSDTIWEKFLPSDYREIISRSASPVVFHSKKQLYFTLCDSPILLDLGKMSFAVDKQSGKKCFMLPARQLWIIWGDTPQYWTWISLPESRFLEVAHLVKVCWFDIGGRLNTQILSPETNYAAYFVFKTTEQNEGFEYTPMKASVTLVGDIEDKTIYLKLQTNGEEDDAPLGPLPRRRKDGWMEIELGEFFNERDNDREVEIKLMETEHLNWKSGLIVEGIELRPKVDA